MLYEAMEWDPLIPDPSGIDVKVEAGTVTLTGEVPSKRIKYVADQYAYWIPGVVDVRNELKVTHRRQREQQERQRK